MAREVLASHGCTAGEVEASAVDDTEGKIQLVGQGGSLDCQQDEVDKEDNADNVQSKDDKAHTINEEASSAAVNCHQQAGLDHEVRIAVLEARLEMLLGGDNDEEILQLKTNIQDKEHDIHGLGASLDVLSSQLSGGAATTDKLQLDLQAVQGDMKALALQLQELTTTVDSMKMKAYGDNMQAYDDKLQFFDDKIEAFGDRFDHVRDLLTSFEQQISGLWMEVALLKSSSNELSATVENKHKGKEAPRTVPRRQGTIQQLLDDELLSRGVRLTCCNQDVKLRRCVGDGMFSTAGPWVKATRIYPDASRVVLTDCAAQPARDRSGRPVFGHPVVDPGMEQIFAIG